MLSYRSEMLICSVLFQVFDFAHKMKDLRGKYFRQHQFKMQRYFRQRAFHNTPFVLFLISRDFLISRIFRSSSPRNPLNLFSAKAAISNLSRSKNNAQPTTYLLRCESSKWSSLIKRKQETLM